MLNLYEREFKHKIDMEVENLSSVYNSLVEKLAKLCMKILKGDDKVIGDGYFEGGWLVGKR